EKDFFHMKQAFLAKVQIALCQLHSATCNQSCGEKRTCIQVGAIYNRYLVNCERKGLGASLSPAAFLENSLQLLKEEPRAKLQEPIGKIGICNLLLGLWNLVTWSLR